MRSRMISLEDAWKELSREDLRQEAPQPGRLSRRISPSTVLKVAMERELTQRQQDCVRMYFFEGMTMQRVGEELGIDKSTVYRHLLRAQKKLRRAFEYAGALMVSLEEE